MARGFAWAVYVRDDGVSTYAKLVDRDFITDPIRGWSELGVEGAALFPRSGRPRMVFGVSTTTGRRNYTIVGNPGADLWTGAATVFVCETNDPGMVPPVDSYTVTRRRGESFPVPGPRPNLP